MIKYLEFKFRKAKRMASKMTFDYKGHKKALKKFPYKVKMEFDVPLLVNKTIDQIRDIIGNSDTEFLEPAKNKSKYELANWNNTYYSIDYSHDYYIDIYFNSKTRKVNYIYLSNCNGDVKIILEDLLIVGNLSKENDSYIIQESMAGKNHDIIMGIKISEN